MALAKRVIPCLDIKAGRVVKGINFVNLYDAGDPVETARRYDAEGADEIVFLDITATSDERGTLMDIVQKVATEITVPLTVGGGARSVDDFCALLNAGADKVSINSAAVQNPQLLTECAERFGAQCVVLAVDARRDGDGWEVVTHGGRRSSGRQVLPWLQEGAQAGAGEILLTSMDADGTQAGYDLPLLKMAATAVDVPIIASGGGGSPAHMAAAITEGRADAVLAASIFHHGAYRISEVKQWLAAQGIEARLDD